MDLASFKALVENELENHETSFVNTLDDLIKVVEREIYTTLGNSFLTRFSHESIVALDAKYLTAGQYYYDLDEAIDIESIYVAGSNDILVPLGWRQLQLRDKQFIQTAYGLNTISMVNGRPRYYAIGDNVISDDNTIALRIILGPTPNTNYAIKYTYYKYPTSLTESPSDTEGTYLSIQFPNVLLYGVVSHGYLYEKGDPAIMAMYKERYDYSMSQLMTTFKGKQMNDAARDGQA